MTTQQQRFGKPSLCVECGKPTHAEEIVGALMHYRFCKECLDKRMAASGCPSDGPTAELETAPLAEGHRGASAAWG